MRATVLRLPSLLLLCAADSSHLPQLENLAKLAAAGQLATLAGSEGLATSTNGLVPNSVIGAKSRTGS